MKKALLVVGAVGLMSFAAEKFIVVKFKEEQINYHWQNLNMVKEVVNQSTMPHNQVLFVLKSIDSLQKDIQRTAIIDSLTTTKK